MVEATFTNMRASQSWWWLQKNRQQQKKIININEINILYVFVSLAIFCAAATAASGGAVRFG